MTMYAGPRSVLQANGPGPELRLLELDQALPGGRWRWRAQGGQALLERNTDAAVPFQSVEAWLTVDPNSGEVQVGTAAVPKSLRVHGSAIIATSQEVLGTLTLDVGLVGDPAVVVQVANATRWRVLGDGAVEWSPDGVAFDTRLERVAANVLGLAAGDNFLLPNDGQMLFRNAAGTTNLSALRLGTDNQLRVGQGVGFIRLGSTAGSSIIPDGDAVSALGTSALRFTNLHLSANVHFGGFLEFKTKAVPADPPLEEARLYLKQTDVNNNDLAAKVKTAGAMAEVLITSPKLRCPCGAATERARDPVFDVVRGVMVVEGYCGHRWEVPVGYREVKEDGPGVPVPVPA